MDRRVLNRDLEWDLRYLDWYLVDSVDPAKARVTEGWLGRVITVRLDT